MCGFDNIQYVNFCEFKCNALSTYSFYLGECTPQGDNCEIECDSYAFSYMNSYGEYSTFQNDGFVSRLPRESVGTKFKNVVKPRFLQGSRIP